MTDLGATDTSTTAFAPNQFPVSAVFVPGDSKLTTLEGGAKSTDGNGKSSASVSALIKDGNDVAFGTRADAAITDATQTATHLALVKGQLKVLADVWDSINHTFKVAVNNANTNGQAIMSASSPVAIASDQTAVKVKPDNLELASLTAGALNADLVPSTDVSAYRMLSLQLNSASGTWTITFQGSNDNNRFDTVLCMISSSFSPVSGVATSNGMFYIPINFRYFRARMTSYSSGSVNGVAEFYTSPPALTSSAIWVENASVAVNTGPVADVTLLASAAQTTTQTLADQTNTSGKGVRVVLDMTSVGTGSVTLEIDAKDVASGKYVSLLTGNAVITNSTNVYVVYPSLTPVANAVAQDVLPRTWRVKVTANNANTCTYSVGASYLS